MIFASNDLKAKTSPPYPPYTIAVQLKNKKEFHIKLFPNIKDNVISILLSINDKFYHWEDLVGRNWVEKLDNI